MGVHWLVVAPAQLINAQRVPASYQVLCANSAGFVWATALSWLCHRSELARGAAWQPACDASPSQGAARGGVKADDVTCTVALGVRGLEAAQVAEIVSSIAAALVPCPPRQGRTVSSI